MKKIIFIYLTFTLSLIAKTYDLKPIQISKDIHCVIGDVYAPNKNNKGFVSNMCYVDIGNSIVVLDAGPTYKFAKEFYKLITTQYKNKPVSHVILTNFHDDRIQGASYFHEIGAKIVGYKNLNQDIQENSSKFDRMKNILSAEEYEGTKVILADTLVEDGYKIKGTTKTLTIIKPSVVSEEKSDIAVYSKDDSFLFVGNIVFNGRLLNYRKASSVDGWIEALENLAKLDVKNYMGGHGKEYDKDSYKPTLEYLKILKEDVSKAYEKEIESADVKQYVKTEKFNYLNHFEQLNYSNIQNYYYQLEWGK
jgi:glyoxylase-like metal-dependent hydrolase (beta-lactamase superfamily II)